MIECLIGPISIEQFAKLRPFVDKSIHLIPIFASWKDIFCTDGRYTGLAIGNLSKLFNEYYSEKLNAVINLEARVEVDWSRYKTQTKIGIFGTETKRAFECLAMATNYDFIFSKCPQALERLQEWGITACSISWLPQDIEHILRQASSIKNINYSYDICFLGTTNNENWAEYPDRYKILKKLININQHTQRKLNIFYYRHVAMSKKRQLLTYSQSKITFRDAANFRKTSPQHLEFIADIWKLKRTVLFWYVEPGAQPAFKSLIDGFNCIMYSESDFIDKSLEILSDENKRLQILQNAYESIDILFHEVWNNIGETLSSATKIQQKILNQSDQNKLVINSNNKSILHEYVAAEYATHHDPLRQNLAFLSPVIGSPYTNNVELINSLEKFTFFISELNKETNGNSILNISMNFANLSLYLLSIKHGKKENELNHILDKSIKDFHYSINGYISEEVALEKLLTEHHKFPHI